ncbi:MAG TPA: hypothetical protein VEA78_05960 [Acidimicrobiales bacterium]|nr:hypothetical protein [Acidimicrobiales bacterium]
MTTSATPRTSPVLDLSGETTPIRSLVRDLWQRRGLIRMLAAKDFHGRYRSASLGVLWSVALPLLQGAVLAVVFTKVVRIDLSRGLSYPVFVVSGTVLWGYTSSSILAGSTVLVDQGQIASKVYFPRLVLPFVPATANFVSFSLSVLVLLPIMIVTDTPFRLSLVVLPLVMALLYVLVVIVGALVAMLHVYFRDTRYIVQATLLVALYATPVIYPFERAMEYRWFLIANPATGPLNLGRWAIFGEGVYVLPSVLSTLAWCVVLALTTLVVYRRRERIAMDRL